jgi:F0F1-type ATP synthase assembly protein I
MWTQAAGVSYLGIFFGVAIIIGYLGGAWADRRLSTGHWLSIVGVLFGIAASGKELYRVTSKYRAGNRPNDPGKPA